MIHVIDDNNNPSVRVMFLYTTNFEMLAINLELMPIKNINLPNEFEICNIKLGVTSRYGLRLIANKITNKEAYQIYFQITFNGRKYDQELLGVLDLNKNCNIKIFNYTKTVEVHFYNKTISIIELPLPKSYYIARVYKPFANIQIPNTGIVVNMTSLFQSNELNESFNI